MTDQAPSPQATRDSRTLAIAATVAALALGRAIQIHGGWYSTEGIVWVGVALVATLVGVLGPRIPVLERAGDRPLVVVMGIGLVLQFAQLASRNPAYYMTEASLGEQAGFRTAMAAVGMVAVAAFVGSRSLRRWIMPLLLGAYIIGGAWVIQAAPEPRIDVFSHHEESIDALADGQNPYELRLTNVYDPGTVDYGFPYPPVSLFMSAPGQLLFGDYRYAHLLAVAVAGALIAYARPSRLAFGAAALFLFTPRAFFVIEEGWTEPLLVLLLAGVAAAALHGYALMPYLAGALLVSKQYAVLLLPALAAIADRSSRRALLKQAAKAAVVAVVVTLPFFLWNPERFVYDLITLQTKFSFNPHALTFLALWPRLADASPPLWLGIALVPLAGIATAIRAPRTPAGFAAGAGLIAFSLCAFSRYADANYYFFIIGALWVAVALSGSSERQTEPERRE